MPNIQKTENNSKKQLPAGIALAFIVSAATAALIYFLQVNNIQ